MGVSYLKEVGRGLNNEVYPSPLQLPKKLHHNFIKAFLNKLWKYMEILGVS